jgi:hypothetical protein
MHIISILKRAQNLPKLPKTSPFASHKTPYSTIAVKANFVFTLLFPLSNVAFLSSP